MVQLSEGEDEEEDGDNGLLGGYEPPKEASYQPPKGASYEAAQPGSNYGPPK